MAKENRFNFTKKALMALPSPPKGEQGYFSDTNVKARGLGIAVTPAGTKTFFLHRRIFGRPERVTIGRLPDLSIEQARNQAMKIHAMVAEDINPQERRNFCCRN